MCDIQVICPEKKGEYLDFAVKEIKFFLAKSGIFAEISEKFSPDGFTLSLGKTVLAEKNGLIHIADDLYDDGFVIKTINKTWFIVSATERGVLFGVYEWLNALAGLKIYACDEFKIGKFSFSELNLKMNPSFAYRSRGWYPWNKYDKTTFNRLRFSEPDWITFSHSMLTILPKSKYYDKHPEYYATPTPMQLCFTNDEMVQAFIKETLERYITPENLKDKRTAIFFVGQEDNGNFCQCERCKKAYEKYKLTGAMLLFVKKVAKAVNERVAEIMPDKTVKTVTFAYGGTNEFPVDENFKPLDEAFVFEKNMGVMITLQTHDMSALSKNERYIKACKALGGEVYIWSYDSIFDDELIYYDTFDCGKYYNKYFAENGAVMYYDNGHYNANISFDELSNYVRSNLLWDVSLDHKLLIDDFIHAFYKEGAEQVNTYYRELCELQKSWDFNVSVFVRTSPVIKTRRAFPKDKLTRWISLLTDGINVAKADKIKARIARERLTPIYLLIEIYGEELPKDYLSDLIEIFDNDAKANNVAYYAEHGPETFAKETYSKITQWRSLLL